MTWFTDIFGTVVDTSPAYNLIFGIALIFAGIISFKYFPRGWKLISLGILIAGIVIATGYWVVI